MKEILLLLDFLCPSFFFVLGRTLRGNARKVLVKESLATFFVVLLFAPVVYLYFSLSVQSVFCAGVLFLQFFLFSIGFFKIEREKKKILL